MKPQLAAALSPATTTSSSSEPGANEIMGAFQGPIKPVRGSIYDFFAQFPVAVLMLLLPLLYAALVAGLGYGIYYYATNYHQDQNSKRVKEWRAIPYVGPIVNGVRKSSIH